MKCVSILYVTKFPCHGVISVSGHLLNQADYLQIIHNIQYNVLVFQMKIPRNSSSKVKKAAAAHSGSSHFAHNLITLPSLYCLQTEPSACEHRTGLE